jgi:signal transduction histidine kinase
MPMTNTSCPFSAFENFPIAVIVHKQLIPGDADSLKFIFRNKVARQITGIDNENVIGHTVRELFPESLDMPLEHSPPKQVSKALALQKSHSVEMHYGDNTLKPLYYRLNYIPYSADCCITVFEDITVTKQNEDKLKRISGLEEVNAELQKFAYIASHDLQEPLRKMASFIELLFEDLPEEYVKKASVKLYKEFILDASSRMSGMVTDLLEYSTTSSKQITKKNVLVSEIVSEAKTNMSFPINESKTSVLIRSDNMIFADESLMVAVMSNLISNAIKFKKDTEDQLITIDVKQGRGGMLIIVSDNGIGFNMSYVPKMFELFGRLHNKNEIPGTGIGLSVVKRIIDGHGGHITARSTPGRGASFEIFIPNEDCSEK